MSAPELPPGHSTVLRHEGGTAATVEAMGIAADAARSAVDAELLAARLEIAELREAVAAALPRLIDERGHCRICDTRQHQEAHREGCLLAVRFDAQPSLAELRELVSEFSRFKQDWWDGDGEDHCEEPDCPACRLERAFAALLAAHPFLASEAK